MKEEAAAAKVTKAKDTLIEAVKEMRGIRQEIANTVDALNYLRPHTPDPVYAPNGQAYQIYTGKMTQFNFFTMADQIRRAGGIF